MRSCLLALVLFVVGCKSPEQKSCEHARDVLGGRQRAMVESLIASGTLAPEEVQELREEVERMTAGFVQSCLALPAEGKSCVARIDEMDAQVDELLAQMRQCEKEGKSSTCKTEYVEKVERLMPECESTFEALLNP